MEVKNVSKLLAIPNAFRQTALALPNKVRQAVALLDDPDDLSELLAKTDAMSAYTKHMQQSTEVHNALQFARLEIKAGLGRVMPAKQGQSGGRGKKKKEETSLGRAAKFSREALTDVRRVHKNAERLGEYRQKIEEHNASLDEDSPDNMEASTAGFLRFAGSDGKIESVLTGNTEWYTPDTYISRCREAMGGIDLDPASNDYAQETVQAGAFYTEADNGLEQSWAGRVFLNPPYKMPLVKQFASKLCAEHKTGTVKQAVFLTDSATDTHWWQEAAKVSSLVCLTEGRIKFYNPAGVGGSPTRGQSFMYFGKRLAKFRAAFSDTGIIVKLDV